MKANALWRTGPDGVKNGMEEFSALGRGEARLRRIPGLRGQSRGGERLEWALGLGGENAGTAQNPAGRAGNATKVFDAIRDRVRGRRSD